MIRKSLPTLLLLAAVPCVAIPPTHHTHPATTHSALRHANSSTHRAITSSVHHETAGMSSDRATQIQTALIKSGYMTGEPTGVWDANSTAAMQKLQGDNGWQTKITPDSRALIKLGLGPQSASPSPEVAASN